MLNYNELSAGQRKWVDLVEILFSDVYKSGIITYNKLKEIDNTLVSLRERDKKYKVGWPIWLITNNAIERGIYKIPKDEEIIETDPDASHPFFEEYQSELKMFGIIA